MIDVLLVILIFLMITTTYSKFSGLEINLPTADAPQNKEQPNEINVVVTAAGDVLVNKSPLGNTRYRIHCRRHETCRGQRQGAGGDHQRRCQGRAPSVIDVMQAAQQAGLSHISFATQQAQR
jgi:biopolymer transport protein ExbD